MSICTQSEGGIPEFIRSIAWLDLPPQPIHLPFCDHLFHFINCQADLDRFAAVLLVDVKHLFIRHKKFFVNNKKGTSLLVGRGPLACADDIHLYLVSSPDCVSIAAPKKVLKRIAAVARSAIIVMEKFIYFFDKYKCLLVSVSPHLCLLIVTKHQG